MINVKYILSDNFIYLIEISGHANYDKKGKDILCAAVSTASIMTYNAIEIFNLKELVNLKIKDGYFKIKIYEENNIINKILENLIFTLQNFTKQYSKYIRITKEE